MIAAAAIASGDLALGRRELEAASALFDETTGRDSFEAIQTRLLRCWVSIEEDDLAAAEPCARASLDETRRHLGASHYVTAEAARTLGWVLDAREQRDESLAAYREAIETMRRGGGDKLRSTAQYRVEHAEVLLALERFAEASAQLVSAVEIESRATCSPRRIAAAAIARRASRSWSHSSTS